MKNIDTIDTSHTSVVALVIHIATQTLILYQDKVEISRYKISTAKNGVGSQQDSGCTPVGRHIIAEKIGGDHPIHTVFVGRVATGERYTTALGAQHPERDWILSRILWLKGLESGVNQGRNSQGGCDTYQRYIYIHGTPDSEPMGVPLSHGCIRMRNEDIVALYPQVKEGTPVTLIEA